MLFRSDLYRQGKRQEARALFHRLIPYIAFAVQHVELAVHIEKRVLQKRGIVPTARMRRPTLSFDEIYQTQIEELVSTVIALCDECRVPTAVR